MPAKNAIKVYVEDGYYHLYNRGVEKRDIFMDVQDYLVFLRFLKEYLLPLDHPNLLDLRTRFPRRKPINCCDGIDLLAFCLMPNHFHLLVKQKLQYALSTFMKALATNYSMYFNWKYKRVGPLFQGIYKAVLVDSQPQLLHLSRYIDLNPTDLLARDQPLHNYPYSSYAYYLGIKHADWIKPQEILAMFRSGQSIMPKDMLSYQSFVEDYERDDSSFLEGIALDDDNN